jgi:GxxExxY protein
VDEDGTVLGDYIADLFVEDCLIVELKACKALASEHVAQLLVYLRACRVEQACSLISVNLDWRFRSMLCTLTRPLVTLSHWERAGERV